MIREPDFYRKLYETKFRGYTTHNYLKFGVPIGNERMKKSKVPQRSTTDKISPKDI